MQQLAAVKQQLVQALEERAELEAALAQRESELRLARVSACVCVREHKEKQEKTVYAMR